MAVQRTSDLQPWARRTLGGGMSAGLTKILLTYQDTGFSAAINGGGELAILGGFTGAIFPQIIRGTRQVYDNVFNAGFRNPQTLRTVSRAVFRNPFLTTAPGYLVETAYSMLNTPTVETMNQFRDNLVTHGWRGAAIGLGLSAAPWAAYGARRQVGERVYNFGHTRGWW